MVCRVLVLPQQAKLQIPRENNLLAALWGAGLFVDALSGARALAMGKNCCL